MKEFKQHKLKFSPFLENLYQSNKPLIIYKVEGGYDLFTDFSKKKYRKETDIFIGFFGYEILCNLLKIKIKNQKNIKFYKGVFYKPETIIKIRDKIKIYSTKKNHNFNYQFQKTNISSPFKLNISYKKYKKIFDIFSKKIREGQTYQIKICTKYKNKSEINPVNFFWKLMKINLRNFLYFCCLLLFFWKNQ